MSKTKRLVLTALYLALGVALPFVIIRSQQIRSLVSPMHIAPLLAGLTLGPVSGVLVGLLAPVLSFLITGMPAAGVLPGMIIELGVYGLVGGAMMKLLHNRTTGRIYAELIVAMIAGRIAGGLVHAFILQPGNYSLQTWASVYLLGTAPGMVIHLVLIPLVVKALQKANLVA